MFSGDYGWMPQKDIKPRVKLFADDDFKFFVFMSIFIFCLAGLVLLITGAVYIKSVHKLVKTEGKLVKTNLY